MLIGFSVGISVIGSNAATINKSPVVGSTT